MITPVEFFSRDVTTFWATSFQLDLKLFDQFLLRRLGAPPLNAVVLVDERCLSDTLLRLTDADRRVAASANRRYLLRPVGVPGGGRFHPKTYFFSGRRRTTLLVGSGNLTRSGLDRGCETFVAFDAEDAEGAAVMRTWGAWIGELVLRQDDPLLRARYECLRAALPAATVATAPGGGPFVTNLGSALLGQILERAPREIEELHLTAPYLDRGAEVVGTLIERLAPARAVHLYLGARTSVDAASLRAVLERAPCKVVLRRYEPPAFVHAKLIGVVGPREGLLVCGSANLSHAALTGVATGPHGHGNVEAVVLREGSAQQVHDAFLPPGATSVACSLDDVTALTVAPEPEEATDSPLSVRLLFAAFDDRRRIVVHSEPEAAGLRVAWSDEARPLALDAEGRSVEPVSEQEEPLVVRLVDADGVDRSNAVVLDDPVALETMLAGREHDARPRELEELDESSELVGLLAWAHRRLLFDIEDTPAAQRAAQAQEQQADAQDTGFWERYVRDELTYDHRSQSYRPRTSAHELTATELLLQEIEAMLHAAPAERRLRVVRGGEEPAEPGDGEGRQWTPAARERVRATNLLRRWARALADPRHLWLASEVPARNYEALICVLAAIWLAELLDDDRVVDLLGETWSALLGGDDRQGLLDRAEDSLARETIDSIDEEVRDIAAGLAFCCLHPDMPWQDFVYAWQPFLVRGIELGVFRPGPRACDLVAALFAGEAPSASQITSRLQGRATWTDDVTWGMRTAELLDVRSVRLVPHAGFKDASAVVRVDGLADPEHDPRTLVLARRAMEFKGTNDVLVEAGDQRFRLRLGQVAKARIDGRVRSSRGPLDKDRLLAVERQQGSLADLLAS